MHLVAPLFFYLGLVSWLTWPLALRAHTHLPCVLPVCGFDTLYAAWVLSYESHALATAPARLFDGNIYFPADRAVLYGPAGLGALPFFAPTYLATGNPALATALLLIVCTALTALGLHLVVRTWTRSHAAGLVAAATFLANGWILFGFVATATHVAALQFFPAIMLLAARPLSRRRALLLALLVAFQCLTDVVYVATAVVAPLLVLAFVRLARRDTRASGGALLAVVVAAVLLVTPVLVAYAAVRRANPHLETQTLWREEAPRAQIAALYWRDGAPSTVAPAALALVAVGGVLGWRRRRRSLAGAPARCHGAAAISSAGWRHGLLWAGVGTVLSLTPMVELGSWEIWTPLRLLDLATPYYEIIRAPMRLGIDVLFGMCVLAGMGFSELVAWLSRHPFLAPLESRVSKAGAAALLALSIFLVPPPGTPDRAGPYPLQEAPSVPESFRAILKDGRGSLLVLAVPRSAVGAWPFAAGNARAAYQSTFHWRPILNGYSSYYPAGYPELMRLGAKLPNAAALRRLVRQGDLGFVWVELSGYEKDMRRVWRDRSFLRATGLEIVAEERDRVLLRVSGDVGRRIAPSGA